MRPGNVHSADGWEEFLEPIVKRYREMDKKLYLRGTPPSPHRMCMSTWRTKESCMQ